MSVPPVRSRARDERRPTGWTVAARVLLWLSFSAAALWTALMGAFLGVDIATGRWVNVPYDLLFALAGLAAATFFRYRIVRLRAANGVR